MFRRSGSIACFFVEGSLSEPLGPSFLDALKDHRFRTIENAAAEQTSIGWVTRDDPTGDSFAREDMDCDDTVWLRMRIDKKSAPTKWLQIYRHAEERATGRKLRGKERKGLEADLLARLLPRILPTINLVDAVYVPRDELILLFATANAVQEAFQSLFYRTFAVSLRPADPSRLALSFDLGKDENDRLAELAPHTWAAPRQNGRAADGTAANGRNAAEFAPEEIGS